MPSVNVHALARDAQLALTALRNADQDFSTYRFRAEDREALVEVRSILRDVSHEAWLLREQVWDVLHKEAVA